MEKPKNGSLFSARNLSFVVLALAIIVSGYLSYLKLSRTPAVCIEGSVFDCGTVLNSAYSEIGRVPIAWLGLGTNIIVVGILVLEAAGISIFKTYGTVMSFAVVLFAFLYSVYLVYVQAFLIQAYCPWCLSHEALITILFGLTIWRLVKWMNPVEDYEEAAA